LGIKEVAEGNLQRDLLSAIMRNGGNIFGVCETLPLVEFGQTKITTNASLDETAVQQLMFTCVTAWQDLTSVSNLI